MSAQRLLSCGQRKMKYLPENVYSSVHVFWQIFHLFHLISSHVSKREGIKVKLHYAYKVRNIGRVRPRLRFCVLC